MIRSFLKNPFSRFLVLSTSLYVVWYFLYELYLKEHSNLDEWVVDSLVKLASGILAVLGFQLTQYNDGQWKNHIGIVDTSGVTIGAPCDGIVLFALFIVFVLSFPGPWKHRAWFLPSGILIIHFLNALRVAALALIVYWNESWLAFNHDYTFTIIVYAVVFGLWWIWIKKFSGLQLSKT